MGPVVQYFLVVELSNAKYSAAFTITNLGQAVCSLNLPNNIGTQAWSTMTMATVATKERTLPRQKKRLDTTSKWSYMFNVSWDNSGYVVCLSRHSGKPYHNEHPQIFDPQNIPMSTKHLSEHHIKSISNVVDSTCNKSAGRNFMFTKFRKCVSSVKLSFLQRNLLSEGPKINAVDDITRMLSNFET